VENAPAEFPSRAVKTGVHLAPGISARDLKPFRILIRSSNWLGDAVMSVPAVRANQECASDAHITIAAPEKIAPVWKIIPEVDAIIRCATAASSSCVFA